MPQFSRTNVSEIKSQIGKKLGRERSQRYFGLLNGLLSRKLSKVEFDKLCVQLVGRENLQLHNLLIRSILGNASQAKCDSKSSGVLVKELAGSENAHSSPQTVNPAPNIFSNGDILPPSPRKIRSGTQNRRIKDRLNSVDLDGKVDVDSPSSLQEAVCKENGDVSLYDLTRPFLNQLGVSAEHLVKRPRVDKGSLHNCDSVHNISKEVEIVSIEDKEHVSCQIDLDSPSGRLQAPLGIPCFSGSIGGANRSFLSSAFTGTSSDSFDRNYKSGELCHTEMLKKRMEKVAEAQGLEGVTLDCANLLNIGLDLYLKQLIRSSVELVGARIGHETIKQSVPRKHPHIKPINGVCADNHIQDQSISRFSQCPDELRNNFSIAMEDFKVAMELTPQQLGEDWPLLLEKVCVCSFEE